jgi:hypothetical protein
MRMRLDDDPGKSQRLAPYGWSMIIDTDGDTSGYVYVISAEGISTSEIHFLANTTKGTGLSDTAETDLSNMQLPDPPGAGVPYPVDLGVDGNTRITTVTANAFGGDDDYLLEFSLPVANFIAAGLPLSKIVRITCGTSSNGTRMDGDGIFAVEGARVGAPGSWSGSMWLGAARNPLVIYAGGAGEERMGALVGERVGGEVGATFVASLRLSIGLRLAIVAYQARADVVPGTVGALDELHGGSGDFAIVPKLQLLRQEDDGVDLALVPAVTLPTGRARDYRRDGFTCAPALALGRRFGGVRLATELGYLARLGDDASMMTGIGDEAFARAGLGIAAGTRTELGATASFATSIDTPFTDAARNYLEVAAGPTTRVGDRTFLFAAGGMGVQEAYGTPDWRLVAGVRYVGAGAR